MPSTRFERFQPLAGVLSGLLLIAGLALTWGDPSSETGIDETFSYWADNRGQHQISGLLLDDQRAGSGEHEKPLLRVL